MAGMHNRNRQGQDFDKYSIHTDAQDMLSIAKGENIETAWDRLADQEPQCGYCALGLSCRNCAMGPCRIDPFDETGPKRGVCGADADIVVSRNLARSIADRGSSVAYFLAHAGQIASMPPTSTSSGRQP